MRIGSVQSVSQIYSLNQTQKKASVSKKEKTSDQLEISNSGKDFLTAKAAVYASPDIREDLVDSLKNRVQSGTYDVSGEDFAAKVLEKYNQMISYF